MKRWFVAGGAALAVASFAAIAIASVGGATTTKAGGYQHPGRASMPKFDTKAFQNTNAAGVAIVVPNGLGGPGLAVKKNFNDVFSPDPGTYCIRSNDDKVRPSKRPAIPSLIWELTEAPGTPSWVVTSGDCPNQSWYEVYVYDQDTGAPSDDVGFMLTVP